MNEDLKYTTPTLEEVLRCLPVSTSLYYVDYTDNLDESLETIQKCIADNNWSLIEDKIDDWYHDQAWNSVKKYKKQLRDKLMLSFGIKKKQAKEVIELYGDYITDKIYDNCNDTVVKKLLQNTSKESIYYDTGYEMESNSWNWNDRQIMKEVKAIKKVLKIPTTNVVNNDRIEMMVRQASYGGQLVIYFRVSYTELMSDKEEDFYTIMFKNPTIAVINTGDGSGDSTDLEQVEFTLPFNRKNLFIDKLDHYSYVYEVCGMCSDWCDSTEMTLSFKKSRAKKITDSQSNVKRESDNQLDKTFGDGKCTTGDMNIKRHRDTFYINDYPCGTKCPHCGTFWID